MSLVFIALAGGFLGAFVVFAHDLCANLGRLCKILEERNKILATLIDGGGEDA